jgi:hypothetical protein
MNLGTYVSLNLNPTLSIPVVDNIGCTVLVYVFFSFYMPKNTYLSLQFRTPRLLTANKIEIIQTKKIHLPKIH